MATSSSWASNSSACKSGPSSPDSARPPTPLPAFAHPTPGLKPGARFDVQGRNFFCVVGLTKHERARPNAVHHIGTGGEQNAQRSLSPGTHHFGVLARARRLRGWGFFDDDLAAAAAVSVRLYRRN